MGLLSGLPRTSRLAAEEAELHPGWVYHQANTKLTLFRHSQNAEDALPVTNRLAILPTHEAQLSQRRGLVHP